MGFNEQRLTVELEKTGETFRDFVSYRIDSSYLTPTDGFEFTVVDARDPVGLRRRLRPLQPVKLYINGQLQMVGRIDATEGAGTGSGLLVRGRDYLGIPCNAGVDPSLRFPEQQSLDESILSILRPFGIASLSGDGYASTRATQTGKGAAKNASKAKAKRAAKLREFKADYDQGAFELAARIAARHGLTIQPTLRRDQVALDEPTYDQAPLYTVRRSPADGGQVITGKAVRNWANVPTYMNAIARAGQPQTGMGPIKVDAPAFGPGALTDFWQLPEVRRVVFGDDFADPITVGFRFNPKAAAPANANLVYAPLFFADSDSRTQDQLDHASKRLICDRLRETLTYSCTLNGHADDKSGAVYAVDTIASVLDGIEDVEEPMWIVSRTLYSDGADGPKTDLQMIRPGSFVL